jgi:hypothetical protein
MDFVSVLVLACIIHFIENPEIAVATETRSERFVSVTMGAEGGEAKHLSPGFLEEIYVEEKERDYTEY